MNDEPSMPRAWAKATTRYEGGYGETMDFCDPTAVAGFLGILTDVLREDGALVDARLVGRSLARVEEEAAEIARRILQGRIDV